MLRWIGRILLITLLAIHLAILLLWWDSWRVLDAYVSPQPSERLEIFSATGTVHLQYRPARLPGGPPLRPARVGFHRYHYISTAQEQRIASELMEVDQLRSPDIDLPDEWGWEWTQSQARPSQRYSAGPRSSPFWTPPVFADRYLAIYFPHWSAAAVSGAAVWPWLGFVVFRHRRQRRRQRVGLCSKCGYDIRANPARCSECGQAPAETVGPA
jgi:hypothetical protein